MEVVIFRWRLRFWLFALVAAAVAPCLAVLGWTLAANARSDREEAERDARAMATSIARRADQELAGARWLLGAIVARPAVRSLSSRLCNDILPNFPLPDFSNIVTLDAQGRSVCSVLPMEAGHSYADRRWFKEALAGSVALAPPKFGSNSKRWVLAMAMPIRDGGGKPIGVAMVALDLVKLGQELAPDGANGIRATVLTLDGTVVTRSLEGESWIGRNFKHRPAVQWAISGGPGSLLATDLAGDRRIFGVASAAEGRWRVMVSVSEDEVLAPLRRSSRRAAALGLLIVAAALAFSSWLSWRFGRPIRRLGEAARRSREQGAVQLAEVEGPAELRAAITHFNELVVARAQSEHAMAQSAARVAQLNRFLRMSWSVSQLIARKPAAADMLAGACRVLVETGGMRAAWAAFCSSEDERVAPVAVVGLDAAELGPPQGGDPSTGPSGLWHEAARTGQRQVMQDVARQAGQVARERAQVFGIRSAAALPLSKRGRVAGVLVVYAPEVSAFEPEVLALLEELSREIGAGLEHLDETEERRKAEEALQQTEARLVLADRLASVGRLAAGVAHEINNPLAYVASNCRYAIDEMQQLLDAALPEEEKRAALARATEALEEACHGSERVRVIVKDLKSLARPDGAADAGPVDLPQVLQSAIKIASNEIRHRAQLVQEIAPDLPRVAGGGARLSQVFLNLLINAAQAIEPGAADRNRILVRAFRAGGRAVVEVSDTGAGIAAELQQRIFEPFFTTKPVGVGTGLGLSICHSIVAAIGGELSLESQLGKGSLFRVVLPLADESLEPAQPVSRAAKAPSAGRRKLLVIDDEPLLGRSIQRLLGAEHDITFLTSPSKALSLLRQGERYDAVLCDVMMPDMTGIDFHAEVGRLAPALGSKVIFMTGGVFTDAAERFLESIPNRRLKKPFDLEELREAVGG